MKISFYVGGSKAMKNKVIKATFIAAIFVFCDFVLCASMGARPAFRSILYAFNLGVGMIYGYPVVRDFVARSLPGCFVNIILFIPIFLLEVNIGSLFGWYFYFRDVYCLFAHKSTNSYDSGEYSTYQEDTEHIDFDYYERLKKLNTDTDNSGTAGEQRNQKRENEDSLKAALDSINNFNK